jgi:hypothetical protein
MDGELRGVKGWLLTFVIIIAVVSPGYAAIRTYTDLYTGAMAGLGDVPIIASIRNLSWATVAFAALVGWFVAWRLLAVHNWMSVRLAIAGIWLGSVGTIVLQYVGATWFLGIPGDMLLSSAEPQEYIRPFIFGIVWTAYLLKSERVANTYRNPDEQAEVFE